MKYLSLLRVVIEAASAFFLTAWLMNYGALSSALGRQIWLLQPEMAIALMSLAILAFWLVATLLFGRIYCSTLCPIGALMDLFTRLRPRSLVYRYHSLGAWQRWLPLALLLAAILLPLTVGQWLLPAALYASLVAAAQSPLALCSTAISLAVLSLLVSVSILRGRLLCNSLCPIGAILGAFASRSLFHFDINTDRCVQCRLCVDSCKAECINILDHTIDMNRCVVCFNCLQHCPNQAIKYTTGRHRLSTPLMIKTDETVS